ncbi:hypothetical protein ATHL_00215 [Anaerolinea thermolimosa]|nr:hypothetical protein [Anaerolinea thermolimosa]GAP05384.1 hypothetical protein ATHL_00215 [Anaerolinea thermolimosa]
MHDSDEDADWLHYAFPKWHQEELEIHEELARKYAQELEEQEPPEELQQE